MKYIYSILFIFVLAPYVIACSAAYQYSLFPLGSTAGQLILLEVELDRYLSNPSNQMMQMGGGRPFENTPAIEVRWKGTLKVFTYQMGEMVLNTDLGVIDILDSDYEEALLPYFQKAYEAARVLPMFEAAVLENVGYCHHDRSCTFMELRIDTQQVKFYASSNEEGYEDKSCLVPFAEKTLLKVENQTKIKFTDFDNVEKEFQVDFFRLWSPQTIRRYTVGGQTVQVFTIGRGDKSRYYETKETEWKTPVLETIGHYIQGKDVVFHGQRFDFFHVF
ncbi:MULTISPECIES: hypothetical protein [unclassified Aureispira]|uniref:hypothetical protein n=1 Tax=unclassified Aureispira TaxID=2649989 RepID=UPI00069725E3|nr:MULTISPECIES: hypothetical protein [unclassified Aureispira]WMX13486.1 hypothetical protein QP953_21800 [Aureispira sp. CCB-E]